MRPPRWNLVAGLALLACGVAPLAYALEIQARIDRRTLAVGEATALEVVVSDGSKQLGEPEFAVPSGVQVSSSGRTQSFSWVNGKSTRTTTFRYELTPNAPGQYTIGPIYLREPSRAYESPAIELTVVARRARAASTSQAPASLVVDVQPRDPYVGQPIIMRVRLIQRAPLAQDPQYAPPPTPGFWGERPTPPESYYADTRGSRVLVTETRTRLYPLAGGVANIGEGAATLTLSEPAGRSDPFQWLRGRGNQRVIAVRSRPIEVDVRPLPDGAPPGFNGAVGRYTISWSSERLRTPKDVAVVVRLDVRGVGNLPLLRTPLLDSPDFEVFASSVDDSLGPRGKVSPGRRRFQWTVLPRRHDRLQLPAPPFVWFDPEVQRFRTAAPPALTVDVEAPLALATENQPSFPNVFADRPLDAYQSVAQPWAFGVAGLVMGAALLLWRREPRDHAGTKQRLARREWTGALERAVASDFWVVAERVAQWLEDEGERNPELRKRIAAARYGAVGATMEPVRAELLAMLSRSSDTGAPPWLPRAAALGLLALALGLCVVFAPSGGPSLERLRARASDQAARAENLDRAQATWRHMWNRGGRRAALAARLAWSELRARDVAEASVWALRGDAVDPRDPELGWVIREIHESGGLAGFSPLRLPIRRLEWALAAFLLGVVVMRRGLKLTTRMIAATLLAVTLVADPVQDWLAVRDQRGVIREATRIEGSQLELEPGQVVRILARDDGRTHISVAREVSGWVPAAAVAETREAP